MRYRPLAIATLVVLGCATRAGADVQISVTALPTVPGLRCSAIDVNDLGDVLVNCTANTLPGPPAVAYVWTNGTRTDITGPADLSGCVGINNAKQVACNTASSTPFLWQNGTVTSLAPGMQSVTALNDLGEVFGRTNVGGANGLRRASGTILTAPASLFFFSGPGRLNNLSQVTARPLTQLYDTIGTWSPSAGYVVADKGWDFLTSLNEAGQMTSVLNQQAMLFTPGRGWQALPAPPGYPSGAAIANSVNPAGQVSGYAIAEPHGQFGGQSHAVFWITRAVPIDLGAFQTFPTVALASNASGRVGGYSMVSANELIPLLWTVTNAPSPSPSSSPTDAAFRWVPSDSSAATGRMTIDAPASGPFSVAASRITSFQFTFAPGVSIQLEEGVEQTGRPVMSFDGTGLDSGTVRLRRGAYAADVIFDLQPDSLGVDKASFDPLGEVNQQVVRRGRWVRENATPAAVPLPPGVLGVIDATQALSDDLFGINSGIAYDSARDVLYAVRGANNPFIYTVTPGGNRVRQLDFQSAYLPNYIPYALSYDEATDHLYVFATDDGTTTTRSGPRVVEMTTDGSQIIRAIAVPSTNGMVRRDGIWIAGTTLRRYSFAGTLVEEILLGGTFPNTSPTAVSSSFFPDSFTSDFLLVDETLNRLVLLSRQGLELAETTTAMLDADHLGGARALAIDSARERMFLLTRSGTIFVLSASFTVATQPVSSSLQLTGSSVAASSSPSPAGPAGSFAIVARFENTTLTAICSLFFKVTELTVDGRRGVDQLETVAMTSTGQQLQGFGEQVLGHVPFDFGPRTSQEFTFRVNLGSRRPFNFLVDAWGTQPGRSGSCR